ncbi:UDP-N-acetylmuramoyl-L-alanine--D-glutamate ligase [Aquibaculum sediminis]|uniref:UDP-N-acetylmuramoyl-L-alanine--D-glutamate ligase n=1 Tax=Aquibaculum sediminis TaxID=3231907 RepID=UPI003454D2B6
MISLPFMYSYVVAVLGLGRSGMATAKALMANGAEVWAWDDDEDVRARAREQDIPLVDLHQANWLEPVTLVISPGIPHRFPEPHPVAKLAREAGVEIICDVELLGRAQPDARYVGITGTNGKSTTTAAIGHVLEMARRRVETGGNLGRPVLEFEPMQPDGFYVLELSSYQMELTLSITFDIAVLLNITPDHLDRHGGLEGYVAAKRNIFRRQTSPRTAIIGIDDPICREIWEDLKRAGDQIIWPISSEGRVEGGVYAEDGLLWDETDGKRVAALPLSELPQLPGRHNWQNAAAAYAAAKAAGVDPAIVTACLRSFPGLPHRQEKVTEVAGVAFVNDSKATNADATAKALACYEAIYWIAGGRAKEGGLSGLDDSLDRVARAFLIGEAAEPFATALEGRVESEVCGDLDTAVRQAFAAARRDGREGAVVLLSPACASFDQFKNFEARGEAFKAAVRALAEKETG